MPNWGRIAAIGGGLLVVGAIIFWPRKARASGAGLSLRVDPGRAANLEPFVDAILREAQAADVAPAQGAAHIMVESGGDPRAIRVEVEGTLESAARHALQHEADADPEGFMDRFDRGELAGQARTASVGLLQLLPATAREVGFTGPSRDLFVPDVAIKFGLRYIGKQRNRYGGDARDAAASHNAGSVKLANPYVAGQLIAAAAAEKISPCAIVRGTKNAKALQIMSEVGGYFETATDAAAAKALRVVGKNVYCNQEYVDAVVNWALAVRDRVPELGAGAEELAS